MIKRINLTIIAIFLLLFSGCDAVLNGMYPEYDTSKFDSDKFDITIDLNVENIKVNYDTNIKIALVPLTDDGMHIADINNIWFNDFWDTNYIHYAYEYLNKQKYLVFAFIDRDGNGRPGFDEPSITLKHYTNYGEEEIFDFSYSEGEITLKAEGTIRDYIGIDRKWLDEFNQGVVNDDYIDLAFSVDGIDSFYRYDNSTATFYISPSDSNRTIDYIDWTVSDDNWNQINYYDSFNEQTVYSDWFNVDIQQIGDIYYLNGIYLQIHVKYMDGYDSWFDKYIYIYD